MRALFDNTRVGASVALCLLCAAPAAAVAGCGGSSGESPRTLLADTFSAPNHQISSGQLALSFEVSASGSSASTAPMSVRLSGPFESRSEGSLPRFALKLDLRAGGHTLDAGATATGSALYLQIAGSWFSTPASTYKSIEQSFAQATRRSSPEKVHSTFSSLGIEPARWMSNPSRVGTATVGGARTVHLSADVNVPAFLADVTKLSQAGNALGLGSPVSGGSAISPAAVDELAKSIRSAHVDVYTAQSDHTLRRLEVTAAVTGTPQTRSLLGGLSTAQVHVLIEFSDVNRPQTIAAPPSPKSASQLLPALQQLVGVLQGSGSSGAGALEPLSKG